MPWEFSTIWDRPSSVIRQYVLELFYPLPDPLRSEEEWRRYRHEDLDALTRSELELERHRVGWRLAFDDSGSAWLLTRLDAIDGLLANVA